MTNILRGLTSRHLPCGCVVGLYETYGGRVVSILDVRGERCEDARHEPGFEEEETAAVVPRDPAAPPGAAAN
jgi:hypothetical protein